MKNRFEIMVSLVSAAVVTVLVYNAYPSTSYDPDGECVGLRNCDDWDCPPWGDGDDEGTALDRCFPCTDDTATIEFCGGNSGPGCTPTITSGGCGVELPSGLCSLAQASQCVTLNPGPNAPACNSRSCVQDPTT